MKSWKGIFISGVIIALLSIIPLLTDRTDLITWFIFTLLYITLSQSWNLIGGYAGQQNLGHAAFFGIGGLVARHLWLYGIPLPLSLVAGAAGAVIFAVIIGSPAFRLKGVYFIIGTLVLAEILQILFYTVLPRASVLPSKMIGDYNLAARYYLSLVIAVITVAAVYRISVSKLGLGMMAIREDEDAAEAAGVNTLKYKLTAFLISTLLAGLAGGVFAYYSTAVQAGYMFSALWTFDAVIIVFVGGVGTIVGPIIGAVFFVLLKQLLSLYLPGGSHVMVFGILFILVVLFLPGGLIGTMKKFRRKKSGAAV
ncbi:MAG: branched-chain amino acid ABC transporter permease [Thermodesulfobacteriota bacterium]